MLSDTIKLSYIQPNREQCMAEDGSAIGNRAVLQQKYESEWRRISFFFRKLTEVERNIPLLAENCWPHLLHTTLSAAFGRSAIPYFDGPQASIRRPEVSSEKYSPREIRQMFISDIRHINGVNNIPADALSRGNNSILLEPSIDIHTFFREQQKDEHLQCLLWEKTTALGLIKICYPDSAEKITYNTGTGKLRPYVPASLCKDIFSAMHSLSHPGDNAYVHLLTDRFVRLQINADVRAWTKMCLKCQRGKIVRHTHTPMGEFRVPDERFKHIHIDITEPLPQCEGQWYLLTCVDRFSRWCEVWSILDMSTYTTSRTFLVGLVTRYGVEERVTTDRGHHFESEIFRKLSQLLGTRNIHTTAYNPPANGTAERQHSSLKASLCAELTSTK